MRQPRPVTKESEAAITPEGSPSLLGGVPPAKDTIEHRREEEGDGVCAEYTMLLPSSVATSLWSVLSGKSSLVVGEKEWQYLRIKQGGWVGMPGVPRWHTSWGGHLPLSFLANGSHDPDDDAWLCALSVRDDNHNGRMR